jgi:hypothetical protein
MAESEGKDRWQMEQLQNENFQGLEIFTTGRKERCVSKHFMSETDRDPVQT